MNRHDHTAEYEELMAYLDGQLAPDTARRVEGHLTSCEACAAMAAHLRQASEKLAAWDIGAAPAMKPPARVDDRRIWRRPRWLPALSPSMAFATAAAALVVIVAGIVLLREQQPPRIMTIALGGAQPQDSAVVAADASYAPPARVVGGRASLAGQTAPEQVDASQGPLLVRTARLSIVPRDFDAAREEVDRIVAAAGGFTGRIVVSGARGGSRSLNATVRVPAAKLDETLAALKRLGTVTEESQDGDDVTQQSVDLDARLSNARASERRLKDILDRRTGDLSDVLAVEREIARVRGEIERMEAERKSLDGRIAYASVTVQLTEERKAAVDLGPLPLSARFRNAFVDGWSTVFSGAVDVGLAITTLLPTLLVLSLAAAPLVALYRRRRARAQ